MRISTIPQIYRHMNRWREILSVLSKYGLAGWISRVDLPFGKSLLKNRNGEVLATHSREARIHRQEAHLERRHRLEPLEQPRGRDRLSAENVERRRHDADPEPVPHPVLCHTFQRPRRPL